jgi:hypothetical protein
MHKTGGTAMESSGHRPRFRTRPEGQPWRAAGIGRALGAFKGTSSGLVDKIGPQASRRIAPRQRTSSDSLGWADPRPVTPWMRRRETSATSSGCPPPLSSSPLPPSLFPFHGSTLHTPQVYSIILSVAPVPMRNPLGPRTLVLRRGGP